MKIVSAVLFFGLLLSRVVADEWPLYPQLVYLNYTDAVITKGETFSREFVIENQHAVTKRASVKISLLDLWEKVQGDPQTIELELEGNAKRSIPVAYTPNATGIFKIRVEVSDGKISRFRDITSFTCLPGDEVVRNPFFGTHTIAQGEMPALARRLGFTMNRVHNMTQFTWWVRMEPEKGALVPLSESRADYDRLRALGFETYGQWFGTPYWATDDRTAAAPSQSNAYPKPWVPRLNDDFRGYIRESLKRFPEIKEWEVWNEPWVTNHFWLGSPEQYAELCRLAYTEAKAARPDITVLALLRADSDWVEKCLKAGVLSHCDELAFHGLRLSAMDHPRYARSYVRRLKEQIAPFRKDLPLVFSEPKLAANTFLRGLDFPSLTESDLSRPFDAPIAARAAVQYRVAMMAEGVRATYAYQHNPLTVKPGVLSVTRNYHSTEVVRSPKPDMVSTAILIRMLGEGKFIGEALLAPGIPVFIFQRGPTESVAVAWTEDGARARLVPPTKVFDVMGNEVSGPLTMDGDVYYFRSSESPIELLRSLKRAPLKIEVPADPKPEAPPVPDKEADYLS